jgi:hypothetical protein
MVIKENEAYGISHDKDELERRKNVTADDDVPWYVCLLGFIGFSSCCE